MAFGVRGLLTKRVPGLPAAPRHGRGGPDVAMPNCGTKLTWRENIPVPVG